MKPATVVRPIWVAALAWWASGLLAPVAFAQQDQALVKEVVTKLNAHDSVAGSEQSKSYKVLFDAYLELIQPPFPIGLDFNLMTIHPGMSQWSEVSGWAESNAKMAEAIVKAGARDKIRIGLPYGREKLDAAYIKAGIIADVGVSGSLRRSEFPYLNAVDTMAAFATAEAYRLMEVGKVQEALDLYIAFSFVVRQFCDREFLEEKLHSIALLSDVMSNLRDIFYRYQDKISHDQFAKVGSWEIPFLEPTRRRLFMPEADRIVSEALIKEVFDERRGADVQKFTETFAEVQSEEAPLTRFGAAKRWALIAAIHGSLDASLERLKLIYDDWWRRWRIDAYDDILSFDTQFERTNPIRYAAVIYSISDVEVVFEVRNRLVAEVNGTALAAGLCGYKKTFGTFPDQTEKIYTNFVRKSSDIDPYDKALGPFHYFVAGGRHAVDTPMGRLWIESGEAILYSLGQDHADNRAGSHSDDGAVGDIVIWPPIKAVAREQAKLP